jgi:hypothetical protein
MKNVIRIIINCALTLFFVIIGNSSAQAQFPAGYKGMPYKDSVYTKGIQWLPGRLELGYYDRGGEGIAYHDKTPQNEGAFLNKKAGEQRPGISDYIAFFRKNEGVDINYTKDIADFGHPNKVDPKVNQLFICNQEAGEWTNYTIYVNHKGKYIIYTNYSSKDNKPAELWVNNIFSCKLTFPEITGDLHLWTQSEAGAISFPDTGKFLLTLKYGGAMNFGHLDFLYNDARQ